MVGTKWFWFLGLLPVITNGTAIHVSIPDKLYAGYEYFLRIWVDVNSLENITWNETDGVTLTLKTSKGLISFENNSFDLTKDELVQQKNVSVFFNVLEIGHEIVGLRVRPVFVSNDSDFIEGESNYNGTLWRDVRLRLLRKENALDIIFLVILATFVIINNVNMGCVLDVAIMKAVFKRPIGPVVGFGSQFLFMPLASFGVASLLLKDPSMQLGLFALGCCPGGTGSNFWTYLFRGDLNLSVVMTFVSSIAALGMMPLWLYTLGQRFLKEGNIQLPYAQLFVPLVSFVLPVGIGVVIKKHRPRWANFAKKIVRPFTISFLIFFVTIGVYTNLYLFRFLTWRIIVAGLIVAWGGYTFGGLAAAAFCMKREQIIAISIETALQNAAIAFVLLKLTLSQPDADIASVSPVAQLMVTAFPLWITFLIYTIYRRVTRQNDGTQTEESSQQPKGQMNLIQRKFPRFLMEKRPNRDQGPPVSAEEQKNCITKKVGQNSNATITEEHALQSDEQRSVV